MKFQEYINTWDGKTVDFDGFYGYQCVDFVRHYCREVLGLALGPSGGSAKTMWANNHGTFNSKWEKIPNNPKDKNQVPIEGDIIFWTGGKYSQYGHVGIVVKGYKGQNKITVIDQNTGSGNGDGRYNNRIRIHDYKYTNVAGWFRLKTQDNSNDMQKRIDKLEKDLAYEKGMREQFERENGILRRRAKEAKQALDGTL